MSVSLFALFAQSTNPAIILGSVSVNHHLLQKAGFCVWNMNDTKEAKA